MKKKKNKSLVKIQQWLIQTCLYYSDFPPHYIARMCKVFSSWASLKIPNYAAGQQLTKKPNDLITQQTSWTCVLTDVHLSNLM